MFWPQILYRRAPEFLELDYLIGADSDHVASGVQWTKWYQWSLESTKLLMRKQARKLQ